MLMVGDLNNSTI